jgi:hypothetical protein
VVADRAAHGITGRRAASATIAAAHRRARANGVATPVRVTASARVADAIVADAIVADAIGISATTRAADVAVAAAASSGVRKNAERSSGHPAPRRLPPRGLAQRGGLVLRGGPRHRVTCSPGERHRTVLGRSAESAVERETTSFLVVRRPRPRSLLDPCGRSVRSVFAATPFPWLR